MTDATRDNRSREWHQVIVAYYRVALTLNRLDAEGWSIHSLIPMTVTAKDDPASGGNENRDCQGAMIVAWRTFFEKPEEPKPSGPFR